VVRLQRIRAGRKDMLRLELLSRS